MIHYPKLMHFDRSPQGVRPYYYSSVKLFRVHPLHPHRLCSHILTLPRISISTIYVALSVASWRPLR